MDESRPMRGVTVADGRMTIEGVAGRFVQGVGRRLRLDASGLQLVGGVASREGKLADASRILAQAQVADDSLRRAGFEGEAHEIALTIRPLAAGGDARMLLTLSFHDEESDGVVGSGFSAELWAPAAVFEALKRDLISGAARSLSLSAKTSLWVLETEREAAPGLPLGWHLGLEQDGRRSAPARGLVETLDWSSAAPEAPPAAVTEEDEPRDAIADQLGRLNWSLKQLLLVLVFVMIIIALK